MTSGAASTFPFFSSPVVSPATASCIAGARIATQRCRGGECAFSRRGSRGWRQRRLGPVNMAKSALRFARSSSLSAGALSSCRAVLLNAFRALLFSEGVSVGQQLLCLGQVCCGVIRQQILARQKIGQRCRLRRIAIFFCSNPFCSLPPAAWRSASESGASLPCASPAPKHRLTAPEILG
ncbi:Uncharacterised protein [Citrobacter koseri]|nr:Uncharacterised protein [Citrobacter koseri]